MFDYFSSIFFSQYARWIWRGKYEYSRINRGTLSTDTRTHTTASRGPSFPIESTMIVTIGPVLLERYFSRRDARMSELSEIKPRSHEAAVCGSSRDVKEVAQRPLPLLFIRSPIQSPV